MTVYQKGKLYINNEAHPSHLLLHHIIRFIVIPVVSYLPDDVILLQ